MKTRRDKPDAPEPLLAQSRELILSKTE